MATISMMETEAQCQYKEPLTGRFEWVYMGPCWRGVRGGMSLTLDMIACSWPPLFL